MNVSRETLLADLVDCFNKSINNSSSYTIDLDDNNDLVSFFLALNPGSFLVVDDSIFLSIFNSIYKSNIECFSVLTNIEINSPAGFVSPLKRAVDSYLINENNRRRVVLVNRSCFEGSYPYYCDGHIMDVNTNVQYENLLDSINKSVLMRVSTVVGPGTYAKRGALIDLYPSESKSAFRVDFSYDNPKIFVYDTVSQLTIKEVLSFSFIVSDSSYQNIETSSLLGDLKPLSYSGGLFVCGSGDNFFNINLCNYDVFKSISKPFFSTNLLHSMGFGLGSSLFVPPWFSNERSKIDVKPIAPSLVDGFENINIGDILVHEEYGLCLFDGVMEGFDGDESSISLVFKDGKISLPVSRLFLLSIFNGSGGVEKISSLSKKGLWARKKGVVVKQVNDFVKELLDHHLSRVGRAVKRGVIDVGLVESFVAAFQYDDTEDQKRAFQEIVDDMGSLTPMDRLLCGDVGFGKTEIAIRAAFLSVLLKGPVVVLAPTTILCNQLLGSFRDRLQSFAVNVRMVSRLVSTSQVNKNLADFNSGSVDVLICTHRIFSHINILDRVGLLIVDEEHRFGVKQKDCFFNKFPMVDVLSMSATPIPRSLQSALSGIKTMSTISTPPINRLPIQTTIDYYDYDAIAGYIQYEFDRDGQVYFLHNNIQSLDKIYRLLSTASPHISFGVVHGKMPIKEIEETVSDFSEGRFHVLISTTIIENGLDISNVNTIIINNAHLFGLSQLHQIRGRVGRHDRQAFAYLLIPKNFTLNIDGKKRLKAIEENVSLGSGYNLSSKDLEIRGAGSVFGYSQSGGALVGFDLYNKILHDSVNLIKGKNQRSINDVVVQLRGEKNFIPSYYIEEEGLRISLYRELLACSSIKDLDVFKNKIVDRFGQYDDVVAKLFLLQQLKVLCLNAGVSSLVVSSDDVKILFLANDYIKNTVDFINWVDSFFRGSGFEFSFQKSLGSRTVLCFDLSNNKKDIYVFLVDLLNKFRNDFGKTK